MRSLTHSVKWGLELLCHLPRGPWADSSLFLATSDSCPGFQPVCPPPWPPGLGQMALTLCTSPLCPTRSRGPWEGADCLSQLSWYPNPCHNTQCTIEGCSPPLRPRSEFHSHGYRRAGPTFSPGPPSTGLETSSEQACSTLRPLPALLTPSSQSLPAQRPLPSSPGTAPKLPLSQTPCSGLISPSRGRYGQPSIPSLLFF